MIDFLVAMSGFAAFLIVKSCGYYIGMKSPWPDMCGVLTGLDIVLLIQLIRFLN